MESAYKIFMEIQTSSQSTSTSGGSKVSWWLLLVILVVVVVMYVLPMLGVTSKPESRSLSKSEWQAIFLDNGQVYFGKVEGELANPVVLKDIYYLQVVQPLQQVGEGQTPAPAQPQLSLVKLGNELHGPMDEMRINREHVLFVEDLKPDSKVVDAIHQYRTQGK